ncbi:MAG: PAS domain S-box-containing protein, partial [Kiritimatiellia bacterium]
MIGVRPGDLVSAARAIDPQHSTASHVQLGLDRHGRVISVDSGWTTITGFTCFEALGRPLQDLVAVSDRAELAGVWRDLRRHGARAHVLDLNLVTDDGPNRRVRVRLSVGCLGSGEAFSHVRL